MTEDWLDAIATATPSPGAGAVSASAIAAAAALLQKCARQSSVGWEGAGGAAAQAIALRNRATAIGSENDVRYAAALAELDAPAVSGSARDFALGQALAASAEGPLRLADVAADVAALAHEVSRHCAPRARGDALAAGLLAAGAADAAAVLVSINLTATPADERVERASQHARRAHDAARRAVVEE